MKVSRLILPGALMLACLPGIAQAQQRREKKDLQHPEQWVSPQGDRMRQELPYLAEADPKTLVRLPLKSRIWQKKFVVYDDFRGEMLRLERKKDYVVVRINTSDDTGHQGRIVAAGPLKLSQKRLVIFYGPKKAFGKYFLYQEIRAFNDPDVDKYPVVVLRFTAPDKGVVYLDPMGSGSPQAIVNFTSAPSKK
jgi:hypothetical protein